MSRRTGITLATLVLACGCSSTQRADTETAVAKALISDQQEAELGKQVKQQLDAQGTRYVQDPVVLAYVKGVAGRIFPSASRERPGVSWTVYAIDDPKTVNAFAAPGGYLYVYTGLLLAADNEAELAGVWGHEAGHVVLRHSARQMVNAYGMQTVIGMALGEHPNQLAALAANVAAQGTLLAYSRGDETEADEAGARYAAAAGYDPRALITFFEKLRKSEGNVPAFAKFLSDHPLTTERISHLQGYIGQHQLHGSDLGADRLQPIKARIGGTRPP